MQRGRYGDKSKNERAKKRRGRRTDSHPYRKLESVLTSRQQVISMEFLAKVRIGRTVQQAGRQAQREQAGTGKYGDKRK